MKFLVATNNKHKLSEIKAILEPLNIECQTLSEANISSNPEEDGKTFKENAKIKAVSAMKISGLTTVADDSGLCVDALGGAPGIYSSRYAGENASDDDRINKLLSELSGLKKEERTARFVCSICCAFPNGDFITCEGKCEGYISENKICDGGFGYDPIFIEKSSGKCFAEIEGEEKNKLSHRGNALREFSKLLSDYMKKSK